MAGGRVDLGRGDVRVVPAGVHIVPVSPGYLRVDGVPPRLFKVEYKFKVGSGYKSIDVTQRLAWERIEGYSKTLVTLALSKVAAGTDLHTTSIEIGLQKREFSLRDIATNRVTKIDVTEEEVKRVDTTFKELSTRLASLSKNPKIFEETERIRDLNSFKTTNHVQFFAKKPIHPPANLANEPNFGEWIRRQILEDLENIGTQDQLDAEIEKVSSTPIEQRPALVANHIEVADLDNTPHGKFLLTIQNKTYGVRKEGAEFVLLNPNGETTLQGQLVAPYLTSRLSKDDLKAFVTSKLAPGQPTFTLSHIA